MPKDTAILKVDPEGIGPAARLVSIFDPASIGDALAENGWTNSEAIEILTEIARDKANATGRERMAAVKMIEDKGEKALTLAGVIQRISLEALREDDGTKKKLTAEGLQLIKSNSARTLSTLELLEAGSQTPEMIDVDPVETLHDPGTGTDVPASEYSGTDGPRSTGGHSGCPRSDGVRRSEPGPCTDRAVHGLERTNPPHPTGPGQSNDQTTTGGAENERSSRTPIQPGGGRPSAGPRAESQQRGREARCNPGSTSTLDRPTYTDPGAAPAGNIPRRSTPRRTTPYTPGEARRRATAARAEPDVSGEEHPTVESPRPSDGPSDTSTGSPRIAARYLPPGLAATGFPGDSTPPAD